MGKLRNAAQAIVQAALTGKLDAQIDGYFPSFICRQLQPNLPWLLPTLSQVIEASELNQHTTELLLKRLQACKPLVRFHLINRRYAELWIDLGRLPETFDLLQLETCRRQLAKLDIENPLIADRVVPITLLNWFNPSDRTRFQVHLRVQSDSKLAVRTLLALLEQAQELGYADWETELDQITSWESNAELSGALATLRALIK